LNRHAAPLRPAGPSGRARSPRPGFGPFLQADLHIPPLQTQRRIQFHEPLKTLGEFTVPVKLHKDVTAHLKVVIEKEVVAE
jgi:hypothetical protein